MSALAIRPDTLDQVNEVVAEFQRLEGLVDTLVPDQLGPAWQNTREATTLMRMRAEADRVILAGKRLEAKLLRKFGQCEFRGTLNTHEYSAARYLAGLDDSTWQTFYDGLAAGAAKTASDVAAFRREREEARWRARRDRNIYAGHAADRDDDERRNVRDAAKALMEDLVAGQTARRSGDLIEDLADELGLDAHEPAIRRGLGNLLINAVGESADMGDAHIWGRVGDDRLHGVVPQIVGCYDDEGFVRVPWRIASLRQLLQMVQRVEDQAAEREKAATALRNVYEILAHVKVSAGLADTDACSELLMYGRIKGLVDGQEDQRPRFRPVRERFPRAFAYADGGTGALHLERLLDDVTSRDIYSEDELDEDAAETIAKQLFTGNNRVTMERFAAAYCPRLVNTFAFPWEMPIGWGLPEDEAEKLRAEAFERIRDVLDGSVQ